MKMHYGTVRVWIITILIVCFAAGIAAMYAVAPMLHRVARTRTEDYLRDHFQSSIQFTDFHASVYPRVRVVIEGLVMRHQGRTDIPPLITVSTITLDAGFPNFFSPRPEISHITLDGLQINIPPRQPGSKPLITGTEANLSKKVPVTIRTITADQARITILRRDLKPPHVFEIHQLEMNNFDFTDPAAFHAQLTNPVPKGQIHCDGQFGPWRADDPSQTPVIAKYTFYDADMGTLKGLKGTLFSEGKFSGPLDYLNVEGKTDIPNFALRTSDHPMALHTDFLAVVDGTNGDTYLKAVTAKFLHTTLITKGEVVDEYPEVKGRTIVMETVSQSARIEDLLALAVKSEPPVMTGAANIKAKILIPEGNADLLERLIINGQFGLANAEFSSDAVQGKINSLSRRGLGKPRDLDLTAASKLQGAFKMDSGDIVFSRLGFAVPGADITLAGDYNLDSGQLNFRGRLALQAKLSQTVTGVKSFFLKAVDPFFKGKNGEKAGTVLPIKITGTKDHPLFGLDFGNKKNETRGNKDEASRGLVARP
jgi:hypothetical protein